MMDADEFNVFSESRLLDALLLNFVGCDLHEESLGEG